MYNVNDMYNERRSFQSNTINKAHNKSIVSCFPKLLIGAVDVLSHRALLCLLLIHKLQCMATVFLDHEILLHTLSSYIEVAAVCKSLEI